MRVLSFIFLVTLCSCSPKDRAGDALNEARRLAERGQFEQALERHVWFHDHALEVDSSYYGVRLSFALSDWVELGKKYPKATETLKGIRDKKTSRLLAGEAHKALFHDVESINDHLGESKATVELFRKLEAAQPEFAASIYDLVEEALIAAEEYALAKKYLTDPRTRFANAKRKFDDGMRFAKKHPRSEASRRAFETIFVESVVRLLTVLERTGDRALAREIQSQALALFESPAIRDALTN